ncbi:hypothetical protein D3C80_2146290 [compost metagenome]
MAGAPLSVTLDPRATEAVVEEQMPGERGVDGEGAQPADDVEVTEPSPADSSRAAD